MEDLKQALAESQAKVRSLEQEKEGFQGEMDGLKAENSQLQTKLAMFQSKMQHTESVLLQAVSACGEFHFTTAKMGIRSRNSGATVNGTTAPGAGEGPQDIAAAAAAAADGRDAIQTKQQSATTSTCATLFVWLGVLYFVVLILGGIIHSLGWDLTYYF